MREYWKEKEFSLADEIKDLKEENKNLKEEVSTLRNKLKGSGEALKKMTEDRDELFS